MTILRLGAAFLMLAVAAAANPAVAEDYPSRPVKIVAPFGAGGPTDVYTRIIADELQKALHQPFVIENRPGAGTTIGTEAVVQSAPDGYTLLMVSGTQCVNETLFPHKHYKLMRDLVPVASLIDSDLVLVVHPSVPAKTMADLLALARERPGTLNYGSSGPGSNYHMAGELLRHLTNINIVHVPYKGSTGARNDIVSGNIQILFDSVPTMAPLIKSGYVRPLGTSGVTRSPILPDVPTLAESGVPDFQASLWVGFMAPAGTPAPIIDKLNTEIGKILARPDIKEAWEKQGATPVIKTPAAFKSFMEAEIAKWADIIAANHITTIN
jgi:tripartite-type tricarboxylate transporter receptor subunit TctC